RGGGTAGVGSRAADGDAEGRERRGAVRPGGDVGVEQPGGGDGEWERVGDGRGRGRGDGHGDERGEERHGGDHGGQRAGGVGHADPGGRVHVGGWHAAAGGDPEGCRR